MDTQQIYIDIADRHRAFYGHDTTTGRISTALELIARDGALAPLAAAGAEIGATVDEAPGRVAGMACAFEMVAHLIDTRGWDGHDDGFGESAAYRHLVADLTWSETDRNTLIVTMAVLSIPEVMHQVLRDGYRILAPAGMTPWQPESEDAPVGSTQDALTAWLTAASGRVLV